MNRLDEVVIQIREICREIDKIEKEVLAFHTEEQQAVLIKKEYERQKEKKMARLIELIKENRD